MKFVSKDLRNSAEGQECQLRIPGVCRNNKETVVLCHLDSIYKGRSIKSPDFWAVFGCYDCHAHLDDRRLEPIEEYQTMMAALLRTWVIWVNDGLIQIPETIKKPRTARNPYKEPLPRRPIGKERS